MEPLISIVIPYYNGEQFIDDTLESLFAQNYKNLEIILVNDGSSTTSRAYLEKFHGRITIIDQENRGIAAARNTGIKHAQGTIIGIMDQDDLWPQGRLVMTLQHLVRNDYGFIRGHTKAFEVHADGSRSSSDLVFLPVLVGAALYKRTTIDTVGPFDESMKEGDDFDWNIRLNETQIPWKEIPELTLLYRKHGQNHSITNTDFIRRGLLVSAKKKLDRMRNTMKNKNT